LRKSHIRDYATEAFRFWAREGSAEAYRAKIWEEAMASRAAGREGRASSGDISKPTESTMILIERRIDEAQAEIMDLEAVDATMRILGGKKASRERLLALRLVYMQDPHRDLEKGEVADRVHQAELLIPASAATIYRWLSDARITFALERKLRL